MRLTLVRTLGALALSMTFGLPLANAQAPAPAVRGTIESVNGATLTVKGRDGAQVTVRLADNVSIVAGVKITIADIKQGAYIGVTSVPQADGTWRASEVHVFPESMRGTGEGDRPLTPQSQNTMTNAAVSDIVSQVDGRKITLTFPGGQKTVVVPLDALLFTYAPGDRGDLKPGASVVIRGPIGPDGSLQAARINVGRDVVLP